MRGHAIVIPWLIWAAASGACAADLTAEQVRHTLAQARPDRPANFSGKSLENLDLSGLDLRGANLAGANLFGAKLDGCNLGNANLSHANLNLAWVMRANFTYADLSDASVQGLVVASGLETNLAEAPIFRGANFSGARIVARFSRFDLRGANFTKAHLGADMRNQSMGLMRTDFAGADLTDANFAGADLSRALIRFANLTRANLAGANLEKADLAGADLTDANLTGANLAGADFERAVLTGVKGYEPPGPTTPHP